MYHNRRRGDFRRDNRHENRDDNYSRPKKYTKTMIFLKSTVFMLFIVLVTLAAALIIMKNKKLNFGYQQKANCKKQEVIKIRENIAEIESDKSSIMVLTKIDRNNKQELIKIDSACGNEVFRVILQRAE